MAGRKILAASHVYRAGTLAALLAVSGCVGSGLDTAATGKPDTSLVTGSIPASSTMNETDTTAIGNAVVTAELDRSQEERIPWANPATGSVGVISYVEEVQADSGTCRRFETSRHSYDGIALFVGETCRAPGAVWRLMSFGPKMQAETRRDASQG